MTETPNFDGLAHLYRWMEYFSFGPWLALTRRTFVSELGACRQALVIGDGDGRFTAQLLRANAAVHVEAVDASAAMLKSLVRRAGKDGNRIRTVQADARRWELESDDAPFDLVATHFFLDCLTEADVEALALSADAVDGSARGLGGIGVCGSAERFSRTCSTGAYLVSLLVLRVDDGAKGATLAGLRKGS